MKAISTEIRTIDTSSGTIRYTFERKEIKNINLRIRHDGQVFVSAPDSVSQTTKEEYDAKVRRLKSEIAEGNTNLHKLRKEYTAFVQNEQRETLTALLFNGNLSPAEVTKAIAAITALFQGNADHENAIRRLQEIADAQQNSTIAHFVSELEAQETQPTQKQIRGLGDSSQAAEQ